MNLLICVTGSVACIKLNELVQSLSQKGLQIKIVATSHARYFLNPSDFVDFKLYTDEDEWSGQRDNGYSRGDEVLHVELRKWADLMLIAPLDANTMAKMSIGMCDNLLTCILRAWDVEKKILVAPAMNTHMWTHPLTASHITTLRSFGYITIIPPVSKLLACGDVGVGGMAAVLTIADEVMRCVDLTKTAELRTNMAVMASVAGVGSI